MAICAGDHLLAQQQQQGGWPDQQKSSGPSLLGFSHGTAGMAAALARLHAASGEVRFRDAAAAALAYERSHFKPKQGNWPDFRQGADAETFMVSWCHGAPGIALGRACLWGTELWDESCADEIGIALATTAAMSSLLTDHLCCGSLGLMLIMQKIATGPWPLTAQQRDNALTKATSYRKQALARCTGGEVRLRCFGTKEGDLMLPGFFTGLSGMGLALLPTPASQALAMNLLSAGLLVPQG
jgi:lantibiotic modifying enzyme